MGRCQKIILAKCCNGNRFPFRTTFVFFSSHFLLQFLLAPLNASIWCRTIVDIFVFASMSPSLAYVCRSFVVRRQLCGLGFNFPFGLFHAQHDAVVAVNGCLSFNQRLPFISGEWTPFGILFFSVRYCCLLLSSSSCARSSVARYICHFAWMNETPTQVSVNSYREYGRCMWLCSIMAAPK